MRVGLTGRAAVVLVSRMAGLAVARVHRLSICKQAAACLVANARANESRRVVIRLHSCSWLIWFQRDPLFYSSTRTLCISCPFRLQRYLPDVLWLVLYKYNLPDSVRMVHRIIELPSNCKQLWSWVIGVHHRQPDSQ